MRQARAEAARAVRAARASDRSLNGCRPPPVWPWGHVDEEQVACRFAQTCLLGTAIRTLPRSVDRRQLVGSHASRRTKILSSEAAVEGFEDTRGHREYPQTDCDGTDAATMDLKFMLVKKTVCLSPETGLTGTAAASARRLGEQSSYRPQRGLTTAIQDSRFRISD